ncbi:MAG: RNA-binding S4 domain-containing protein [Rhodospirillaceae bacterium]
MTEHDGGGTIRIDKWLWFARFFKTRTLATKYVQSEKLRLNSVACDKPHHVVRAGDVLTFPLRSGVKVIKVIQLGQRRGPAAEAQALYEDLSPPDTPKGDEADGLPGTPDAQRDPCAGRPIKRERRETDKLRGVWTVSRSPLRSNGPRDPVDPCGACDHSKYSRQFLRSPRKSH